MLLQQSLYSAAFIVMFRRCFSLIPESMLFLQSILTHFNQRSIIAIPNSKKDPNLRLLNTITTT